jgi:hypothetical protein
MNLSTIFKPAEFTSEVCVGLKYFAETLKHGRCNLSPAYQRGSVWSQEQRENFMGHLLQGGEVAPLIVQRVPDARESEMLDGKQRAEAILAWLANEVGARLADGTLLFFRDVTGGINRIDVRVRYINLPWEERKSFYVRLNSAGTPHTREQLLAAMAA